MKFKSAVSKFLTNKWVLNIVAFLALFNVIGYMVMGNLNNVMFFIILAVLVRYFSKNMTIVLGVPLVLVNLFTLKGVFNRVEGFEEQKGNDSVKKPVDKKMIDKINNEKKNKDSAPIIPIHQERDNENEESSNVESSNVKSDEHFEVGRPKNGGSKIDYASTIENAYDELNKILGSDGIKSLTDDTQKLMKQQMALTESMKGLTPIVEKIMPMAEKMQGMMSNLDAKGGMSNIMEMAKKMSGSLGNAQKPSA